MKLEYAGEENIPSSLNHVQINVDVNKVSQVVRNLISNALKFTPRDGVVRIFASFLPQSPNADGSTNGIMKLDVCDTGVGISLVSF